MDAGSMRWQIGRGKYPEARSQRSEVSGGTAGAVRNQSQEHFENLLTADF
jgi:hypothetical protein